MKPAKSNQIKLVEIPPYTKLFDGLELVTPKYLIKDHTGEKVGSLTIIGVVGMIKSNSTLSRKDSTVWLAECRCGNFRLISAARINSTMGCYVCAGKERKISRPAWMDYV